MTVEELLEVCGEIYESIREAAAEELHDWESLAEDDQRRITKKIKRTLEDNGLI